MRNPYHYLVDVLQRVSVHPNAQVESQVNGKIDLKANFLNQIWKKWRDLSAN